MISPSGSLFEESCKRWRCSAKLIVSLVLVSLTGCDDRPTASSWNSATTNPPVATNAAPAAIPQYTYEVIHTWPHDRGAFTQGLLYLDGSLFESTGLNGESSLRNVDLNTGKVLQQIAVPAEYFAEGLAPLDGKLFQLTWQNHKGFVYDLKSFKLEKEFSYEGEGWGLTTDGKLLIMSDGTSQIRFLDPATFEVKRILNVVARGLPVKSLNELEYVKGEILANIWGSNYIVRIDPATGNVVGVVDLKGLLKPEDLAPGIDVLNGIAYDAAGDRLFVTGKRWPKLFEIRLKTKPEP
jgi:glutamine cyclotransferase